jgi:hypothetical protein
MVTKKDETPDVADEAEGQPTVEVEEDVEVDEVDEAIEVKPEGNRISLRRGAAYRLRTRTRRLTALGRGSTSGPGAQGAVEHGRAMGVHLHPHGPGRPGAVVRADGLHRP